MSLRDWSSDVCSSDLGERFGGASEREIIETDVDEEAQPLAHRSEERRVGKECRSRSSPAPHKITAATFGATRARRRRAGVRRSGGVRGGGRQRASRRK